MTIRTWVRDLFALTQGTIRKAPARFRPRVEGLEDRVTPATIHVANFFDDIGPFTLRSAINVANEQPGADTIDFIDIETGAPISGTITLGGIPLPPINGDLTILGQGKITVSGNDLSRVLGINPGVTVNISGLTITNGSAIVGSTSLELNGGGILNLGTLNITNSTLSSNQAKGSGGGIYNAGTLTVDASTFAGNRADAGGGIGNQGTLTVTASTLSGNSTTTYGGGISNNPTGTATVTASTLAGNSTLEFGGGIYNLGTMTVSRSTLSGNSARDGGGIRNSGTMTVDGSTLFENTARYFGGGIDNGLNHAFGLYGRLMVNNSTIVQNVALHGGGISNGPGTVTVTNSTISGNRLTGSHGVGGGINNSTPSDRPLTLFNTIVAGNQYSDLAGHTPVAPASANNLIGSGGSSGGLVNGVNGNLVGVDPKLGPLANNGGPTKTMELLPGSPAFNAGSNALVPAGATTDQRGAGYTRIRTGTVDIGAYEVQINSPTTTGGLPAVTVNEGSQTSNSGRIIGGGFQLSVPGIERTTTASVGTVVVFAGGEWEWRYTPADGNGATSTVTITASDVYGLTATVTFDLTVNNVAPTITTFSVPATATEGDTVTVSAAATDPGVGDALSYNWLVVDPNGISNRWDGATISPLLPDDGIYNFYLQVSDGDGGVVDKHAQIVAINSAPTVAISGAGNVNEGATYTLRLGNVTDPGTDEATHYVVHWGDDSSDTYFSAGDVTHVYAAGTGTRAITVDLIDEDGTHLDRANPLSVTLNAPPTDVALDNSAVAENQPAGTVVGEFGTTDPDGGGGHTYALVSGDGGTDNDSFTIDADGNLKTVAAFDYEAKSSYSIRVQSTDAGGLSAEKVFTVSVTDVNEVPTDIVVPAAQTAYENVAKAISVIIVGDPDGGTLTVTLAVGHGTLTLGTTAGLTVSGQGSGAVTLFGGIADLNAALAALVYRGSFNYSGADTLRITANDASLSTSADVALTVLSATQQAEELGARVDSLRKAGVLTQGQATVLKATLNPRGHAAAFRVRVFLRLVVVLRRTGRLNAAQATELLGRGNTLLLSVTRR